MASKSDNKLATARPAKTRVFVSYSRHDADFVSKLVAALASQQDIQVFQDTADVLPSEEWRNRLASLIGAADTVVFCLSPNSATSQVCAWEVELAEKLSKRIIPVVAQTVDGPVPGGLSKLNYIFFSDPALFNASLGLLLQALRTDIVWIREHSRIGELSRRWETIGKRKDLLLRGAELQDTEKWARLRPADAPPLTAGTAAFIDASHDEERAFRRTARRVQVAFTVLLLGIIGGLVAYINQDRLRNIYYWHVVMRGHALSPQQERAVAAKPGTEFQECRYCPAMAVVPPGSFEMGSYDESQQKPMHHVVIPVSVGVSKSEVTYQEWDVCAAAGSCAIANDSNWGRGSRPVMKVSWDDAKRHVEWLSSVSGKQYRLMSESEWEYAARAGRLAPYAFGDEKSKLGDYAWYEDNSDGRTHPVSTKKPNAFGLYDMHGNVFEWVEDCWSPNYEEKPARLKETGEAWTLGDCSQRVARGGSYLDDPRVLRFLEPVPIRHQLQRDFRRHPHRTRPQPVSR